MLCVRKYKKAFLEKWPHIRNRMTGRWQKVVTVRRCQFVQWKKNANNLDLSLGVLLTIPPGTEHNWDDIIIVAFNERRILHTNHLRRQTNEKWRIPSNFKWLRRYFRFVRATKLPSKVNDQPKGRDGRKQRRVGQLPQWIRWADAFEMCLDAGG